MWSIISPGGSEVHLVGLSVSVRTASGAGMPPIDHITTSYARQPGSVYQQSLAGPRRMTLRLVSRQRQATLQITRLALIEALNPDLVSRDNPAYLVYTGVSRTLRLPIVYDGGLENSDDQAIELQFLAYEPVWAATSPTTRPLDTRAALADADHLVRRSPAGAWDDLPTLDGAVEAILVAADGTLYLGGAFTGYVRRWDDVNEQWVTLGSLNGEVACLAEGPDGTLYAGGAFTSPGSYVASWSGSAWLALGNPEIEPNALALGNDGTLYVGGSDQSTPASGETVKQWDGGTGWTALGSGAEVPGGTVYAMLIDSSGTLVIGGAFAGGVKEWTSVSWRTLGAGLAQSPSSDPDVRALARGPDGTLYAGGDFDRADGALASFIARWNGISWQPLGSGMGAPVYALAVRQADGILFAGGQFTVAGGLALPDKMAQWNGYAWFPLDINLDPSPDSDIAALAAPPDGSLLAGYGAEASADSAAVSTVTNQGSAASYPIVTIQGPGRLYQLVNWTSGEAIYFSLTLLDGEALTIDLRPEQKTVVSSFRGNLLGAVVPGSNLATWRLLPGDNLVSLFVDHADASASLSWYERHWSLDGANQ